MPRGYTGAPATRYLGRSEAALSDAVDTVQRVRPLAAGVSAPAGQHLPFGVGDARYPSSAGIGGGDGIVADDHVCESIARLFVEFESIWELDYPEAVRACEQAVAEALDVPRFGAQVRLVTAGVNEITDRAQGLIGQGGELVEEFSRTILAIAGGSDGVELTQALADVVRADTEACLRRQVTDMQDYAARIRAHVLAQEALLPGLDHTANTATRTVTVHSAQWSTGLPDSVEEVDWSARNAASRQAETIRAEIDALESAAGQVEGAADVLEGEIRALARIFEADADETTRCDNTYARRFTDLTAEMRALTSRAQTIRDSFDPTTGITCFAAFRDAKQGLSTEDQAALIDLMVSLMTLPDGTPNWPMIEEILGRDYDLISDLEWEALATALANMEDVADWDRFLELLTDPLVHDENDPNVVILSGIRREHLKRFYEQLLGVKDVEIFGGNSNEARRHRLIQQTAVLSLFAALVEKRERTIVRPPRVPGSEDFFVIHALDGGFIQVDFHAAPWPSVLNEFANDGVRFPIGRDRFYWGPDNERHGNPHFWNQADRTQVVVTPVAGGGGQFFGANLIDWVRGTTSNGETSLPGAMSGSAIARDLIISAAWVAFGSIPRRSVQIVDAIRTLIMDTVAGAEGRQAAIAQEQRLNRATNQMIDVTTDLHALGLMVDHFHLEGVVIISGPADKNIRFTSAPTVTTTDSAGNRIHTNRTHDALNAKNNALDRLGDDWLSNEVNAFRTHHLNRGNYDVSATVPTRPITLRDMNEQPGLSEWIHGAMVRAGVYND